MGCSCSSSAAAGSPAEDVSAFPGPQFFQVTCVRDEEKPLGLQLQHNRKGGVFVRGIESDGIVSAWNEQHPSMQVSLGDRLVAVNGIQMDPSWGTWCSILLELRKHKVAMVFARARAEDLSRLTTIPCPPVDWMDQILPANFLDSMVKHTVAECDIVECCICLEELDPDTTVVQLPCKHAFHRGCAETWLTRCPTYRFARCPTCRQQLVTPLAVDPKVLGAHATAAVAVQEI